MEVTNISQALKALNKVEDARDKLRAEYEKKESKLKAAREQLEQFLIQGMREQGFSSFQLPNEGVATIREKRRFGVADWSLFWEWVLDNRLPHLLQKRLLDTAMQDYLETTGKLPPAINTEARLTISVTKRG